MEASTTINKMLAGNRIFVPTYQRAYSWDTEFCLLYTSDAADDLLCVDLGGRRIIKKKKHKHKLQH